jgi:hypothetical protein
MPELSNDVSPDEPLARYLFSRNHYSPEKKRVRHQAFMPKDDNLEVSVFRIIGLTDIRIWKIGETIVHESGHPSLKGRADILTLVVQGRNLAVTPDKNPPRHANIVGWPEDKSKRLQVAIELAERATLKLKK